MTQILLICWKYNNSICWVTFCPFCRKQLDEEQLQDDDYVKRNCLFECECGDFMICPTGVNSTDEMYRIITNKSTEFYDSCTKKISLNEAELFSMEKGVHEELRKVLNHSGAEDLRFYLIGVLTIRSVCGPDWRYVNGFNDIDSDSEELSDEMYQNLDEAIYQLNKVPTKVDVSHDGPRLYYQADCSVCHRKHNSYIWGD
jgi:hypothetical protein